MLKTGKQLLKMLLGYMIMWVPVYPWGEKEAHSPRVRQ